MAAPQVVLIVGATGLVGFPAAEAFLKSGKYEVRLLTQPSSLNDASKAKKLHALQSKGAKLVEGKLDDVDSLKKALQGVHTVLSALSGPAADLQINLLNAAKSAGVTRFVPSEFGFDYSNYDLQVFSLWQGKQTLREATEKSGLEWTYIITGGFFETSFLPWNGFDVANNKVTIVGDGNTEFAVSGVADFTQVLPEVLSDPKSKNATVYLYSQNVTWNQVIELFEKKHGKKFEKVTVTPESVLEKIKSGPIHVEQIQYQFGIGGAKLNEPDQSKFSKHRFQTLAEWLHSSK